MATNHLISVREIKKMQIQNFFHERYGDINVLSKNPLVVQSLPRFSNAFRAGGFEDSSYKQVDTYYGPLLEHFLRQYGYNNMFLVDTDGNICFGVKRDEYIGTNLKTGEYSSFSIGEVFKEGLNNIKFSDLTWCEEAKDFIFMAAAPVYDLTNKLLGTVIVEVPYSKIDIILAQRDGLGDTGEIYIVGDDHFMRSKSRFISQNTILKLEINTEATRDALRGNTDVNVVKDYRNIPVLSAYTPLENLRDVTWALLIEIDIKEAFYPVLILKTNLIIISTVISVITAVYLYFTLRRRYSANTHIEPS
ncbi:MAG TPA: cache domain-containing protein [Candidatus Wunengus sp. YC60]|uniref:cache domain-containing protein n=1 Tax=Candidatus Wunengus sp. YC60 TaxID=3367697 RepID=UPI00402A5E41